MSRRKPKTNRRTVRRFDQLPQDVAVIFKNPHSRNPHGDPFTRGDQYVVMTKWLWMFTSVETFSTKYEAVQFAKERAKRVIESAKPPADWRSR